MIIPIPFTVRIFARYEILIRKPVNLNIRISFYREFKNEMTYKPSKYIYNLFDVRVIYICTARFKNRRCNSS